MEAHIMEQAKYWSTSKAFDDVTHKEIALLIESNNETELINRFYKDLEFGTGGMRGIMGAGTAYMNIYNIRKASTALSRYLKDTHPERKDLKIAISHDSRNNGRDFVKAAAEVFAAHGIKTLITKEMRPVPMLSYMVRHFKCDAGVCVTASHNPPEYNGYKVYWGTGGQLVPPHDKNIVKKYSEIQGYEGLETIPYENALKDGLIELIGDELDDAYFEKVKALSLRSEGRENFSIAYSPLHGTGIYAVPRALKDFGFDNIHIVEEQSEPDGNFPTVKSPNPEDRPALDMALNLAKEKKADIVLATDPDTDRIAVVAREHNEYIFFNGNQLGCLLIDYVLSGHQERGTLPKDAIVIKTIVTTELQDKIAHYYGSDCRDTLTGFKWICDLIEGYETGRETPYRKFICGGEESYGFMADSFVRDKDAVIGCSVASERVAWHKHHGRTLTDALDQIFMRHGVYQENLHTMTLPGKEGADRIKEMMANLRSSPPSEINGNRVLKLIDVSTGEVKRPEGQSFVKSEDFNLPSSNVLQFYLENGIKVSVRPSGTEPKIKFYISVNASTEGKTKADLPEMKIKAQEKCDQVRDDFVALVSGE